MATSLKILVTGPTGTTGRAVVKELLDRGHKVTGMSRNPQHWGVHPDYTPVQGSQTGDVDALTEIVDGHDVVVSAFAPSHSYGAETYHGIVEGAWRMKVAVKRSRSQPYLIYIGGAGKSRMYILSLNPSANWRNVRQLRKSDRPRNG